MEYSPFISYVTVLTLNLNLSYCFNTESLLYEDDEEEDVEFDGGGVDNDGQSENSQYIMHKSALIQNHNQQQHAQLVE